ncbi:T-complex protein 1 subunit alpha isoform X1 [Brassica napus]|uniref:T-complex protein 1 subunit alpha isoform X1 n=1 Tax=Brassica napus TaxID=3708 RepID=UPI00207AAD11|nr:T-complex protein 1 subunit alpha isoform X1 [Brassica napus]
MSISAQNPDISGERQSGQDVRTQNVMACQAVSNIVKTSLGPVGLDKMLVDDIGDVTITNDGATILRMLEVEHPAAKVLVELAELQDREVGDGTTSVVIVAAELLKRANDLVRNKIHPTSIISGYRLAMREACKYIEEKLVTKVEKLGKAPLINCAKTSMSSKLISGDSDFFANLVRFQFSFSVNYMSLSYIFLLRFGNRYYFLAIAFFNCYNHFFLFKAVDAVLSVKMTNQRGEIKYPIKGINILKAHGQSAKDSYLLNGYALNTGRAAQGMPLRVSPAKIACLDFNLQKTKMQLGVQVVVNDPRELEKIRQREADMTKERIEKLLKAGANVILTTKGIDDMALKYFVEAGAIAVRRVRKEDMRHVAKATGATLVTTFADMEGEETFDPAHLGSADEVVEERIADDDVVLIKGTKTSSAVSVILRGANDYMLDEMERALHDSLCIVKRTLESNTVVAGGGAVESALSVYLEHLATTLGSREQLAIAEFADALLIIPKVLAVNAAKDATELVAKLRAYHHTAQTKADKKHYSSMGLDLVNGTIRNNLEAGVIEPAMSKVKIIQFATEAAITILRIDDMIKLVKEDGQGDE